MIRVSVDESKQGCLNLVETAAFIVGTDLLNQTKEKLGKGEARAQACNFVFVFASPLPTIPVNKLRFVRRTGILECV